LELGCTEVGIFWGWDVLGLGTFCSWDILGWVLLYKGAYEVGHFVVWMFLGWNNLSWDVFIGAILG
jgi:hypothetical protein